MRPTQNVQENRSIANQNTENIGTRKNNNIQTPFENNSNNLQNNTRNYINNKFNNKIANNNNQNNNNKYNTWSSQGPPHNFTSFVQTPHATNTPTFHPT